jgi:hypothetical protein
MVLGQVDPKFRESKLLGPTSIPHYLYLPTDGLIVHTPYYLLLTQHRMLAHLLA